MNSILVCLTQICEYTPTERVDYLIVFPGPLMVTIFSSIFSESFATFGGYSRSGQNRDESLIFSYFRQVPYQVYLEYRMTSQVITFFIEFYADLTVLSLRLH